VGNNVEERMSRLAVLLAVAVAAASVVWPLPGLAQQPYPSRAVKIVVPAAPGSTTDILARLVADQLSRKWAKPAIVENIAGGALNIGSAAVARAAPDGYTLLVAPPVSLTFSHLLHRNPGYDPTKLVPITILAEIPNVLVVRKDIPAATLKELIDYGKLNPGKLTYASGGAGSTAHLSAAQFANQTGINMVHVTYRGARLFSSRSATFVHIRSRGFCGQSVVRSRQVRILVHYDDSPGGHGVGSSRMSVNALPSVGA
jgi:tripartite-type tricarboxylate transporter receptor subunit TctC